MPRKKKSSLTEFSSNISIWQKNRRLLYDTIYEKKLDCPSYSCTFGNTLSENKDFNTYRLFQSRATNANYLKDKHIWQGLPHALLICNVSIPNNNYNNNEIDYEEIKRIIHPGPILRIKQMDQYPQIVATHTQHKYVFLWNTATQHDREMVNNSDPNTPELILKGHKKDAVYALDFSHTDCCVASGSKDNRICVWNIGDYGTILSSLNEPSSKERFVPLSKPSPKLKPRIILRGHLNEVSDVEFSPYSPNIIASVSYDKSFKLWDMRTAHSSNTNTNNNEEEREINECMGGLCLKKEITNLSWNLFNNNYILTATIDGTVNLIDIRNMAQYKIVKQFNAIHNGKISSLEWNPSHKNSNYFLSSSHDGSVVICDMNKEKNNILFKHCGHMNHYQGCEVIHSSSWIKHKNSFTIASTSSPNPFVPFFWSSSSSNNKNNNDDNNNPNPNDISQGGIMHIWTPNKLLNMDKDEIIKHLKEKKLNKFVDDLKKKKNKNKKNNNNNNTNMGKIQSENEMDNEDIDIQMIDINKNHNHNKNNNNIV